MKVYDDYYNISAHRGSLVSKIKKAMIVIFRELPLINTNHKESKIMKWKQQTSVKCSFAKLFKKRTPLDEEEEIDSDKEKESIKCLDPMSRSSECKYIYYLYTIY